MASVMRSSADHAQILNTAQSALHCDEPLFQHGFPVLQDALPPPKLVVRWCAGVEVDDFQFTGDVFSDASVHAGCRKGNERAGWAAVMINDAGLVTGGIYGTCPDFFPTSLRAELWGALQVLRHALPPVTIWLDNAGVVDGFARGRSWCCSSDRPAADLWRRFWWKLDDLGGEGIDVRKVKGHANDADIESGASTPWQRNGNQHADFFAGRGSLLAEELSPTRADADLCKRASAWYSWLSHMVAHWPNDTTRRGPRHAISSDLSRGNVSNGQHQVQRAQSGPRSSHKSSAKSSVAALGVGHNFFASGALIWCPRCGAYGEHRFVALKAPCSGMAEKERQGQLSRLVKGEHPLKKGVRLPLPVRYSGPRMPR